MVMVFFIWNEIIKVNDDNDNDEHIFLYIFIGHG